MTRQAMTEQDRPKRPRSDKPPQTGTGTKTMFSKRVSLATMTPELLLGLAPEVTANVFLRNLIAHGLPVQSIDMLAEHIAPKDTAFKYRLVPKATLDRRKRSASKTLTIEEGDRAARLAKTFSFALEIYGDEEKAREFMSRPHAMLDGETPTDVAIMTSVGTDTVVNLLGRMAYGGGV